MKCILFSFALLFSITGLVGQNNELVTMPELAQKIAYLSDKYEGIRNQKNEMLLKFKANSKEIKDLDARLEDQSAINYAATKKIIETNGFPDHDMVGKESTHKFWMMVQHMDKYPDFQMQVLRVMANAVDQNKADWIDFAYLTDRVLLNQQRPQHYGTQVYYDQAEETYKPHPVDDITRTNERRAELGLPPLDDFLANTNKKYEGAIKKQPVKDAAQFERVQSADAPGGFRKVRNY